MSQSLSDVEARAQRRRTRTREDMWQELVQHAWHQARTAPTPADARRWLERAHRMLPNDGTITMALAGALLEAKELGPAAELFHDQAHRHGLPEAWAGLATCAHLLGKAEQAQRALEAALRSGAPTASIQALAAAIAPRGWCGLDSAGVLHATPGGIELDQVPLRLKWSGHTARLPPGWHAATSLVVPGALGSPLPIRPFAATEGFVEAVAGGVTGWAWHPADPGRPPTIRAEGPRAARTLRLTLPAEGIAPLRPLARPRRIALTAAEVAAIGTPISLRGADGRHLLGSPLDPGLEARAAADPTHTGFAPVWADVVGAAAKPGPSQSADVVVPVHNAPAITLACLRSVLASLPPGARLIVVDDASRDAELAASLDTLARHQRITLLRLPHNAGFPAAANAGLREATGDAVLLNSDTLVPPGWLERLRAAAYSAPDIGTVTPFTNDGTIVSYPSKAGGNPAPDAAGLAMLDALAARANGTAVIDLPVAVGFCMYLRRDCLDQAGLLREDLFAQGYGEENDLCLRARHRGWRNVAAPGVFVAHVGAASFGSAREHLVRRNAAILARLHPGYDALILDHLARDPLGPARHRMDALRWAAGRRRAGAVVIVTHGGGGGVEHVIAARVRAIQAEGRRPIVLRPTAGGLRVEQPGGDPFPNLIYPMPGGFGPLTRLLHAERPCRVELHHMLGHHADLAGLAERLGVEQVSVIHDYARFCPRIALVSTGGRYCGEPDIAGCEACIADLGSLLEDDPPVPELIERSARELARSVRVVAPSMDAALRLSRHFPGVQPVVEPWEDDRALPRVARLAAGPICRVVVVGALGVEKGYDVLLGCVRDARARALPLEFVVVGYTQDDARLMAAGPVFVTGEYAEADAVALIQAQAAHLALIPSVWPETWCFALTRAWEAGLNAAVFDLGAQAARVRDTGRGWVLPLGLAPRALNDGLLRLAPAGSPSQSPTQHR